MTITVLPLLRQHITMPGTPNSSNPALPARKRKWKADHVVKIDLGDDESEVSTAVIQQASHDGRRIGRTFHPIPVHNDPPPAVPCNSLSAEHLDFAMDLMEEDDEGDGPNTSTPQVSLLVYVPFV